MGQNALQILVKFIDKYATSEHNHSFASDLIIVRNLNENTYILLTAIPLKYRIAITYEDRDPALEMFVWTNIYICKNLCSESLLPATCEYPERCTCLLKY